MKHTNALGMLIGLSCLLLAIFFAADDPSAFLNLPGFLIVAGGTLAAIAASYPLRQIKEGLVQLMHLRKHQELDLPMEIARLVSFSRYWFRHQYREIDHELETLKDPFLRHGLQMIRDQQNQEDILTFLNWRIAQYRTRMAESINLFRAMATYAPAFGMVGSLVGLVNMLKDVETGGFESMTADMAIALVTTFYGLMLANLLFKPIATKLEQKRQTETLRLSLLAEGMTLINQGRTPGTIQDTLFNMVREADVIQGGESVPMLTAKVSV